MKASTNYGPARWLDRLLSFAFWATALLGLVVVPALCVAMVNSGVTLASIIGLAVLIAVLGAALKIIGELRDFIASIARGDAFNTVNAPRLRQIAWLMALIDLLFHAGLLFPKWEAGAVRVSVQPMHLSGEVLGLVLILTVFTLAEAFRQGAKLHNEAQLTV